MLDSTTVDIDAGLLTILGSEQRSHSLAGLAGELALLARDSYPETGIDPASSLHQLRCINELVIVVYKQLGVSLGVRGMGYPDSAFVTVLREKAKLGRCEPSLQAAVEHTLRKAAPRPGLHDRPRPDGAVTQADRAVRQASPEGLPTAVIEGVLAQLRSDRRLLFLSELGDEVTLAGRSLYLGDIDDEARAVRGLRRLNELQIVITEQVRALLGDGEPHPSAETLANQLVETAQQVGLGPSGLSYMMERALQGVAAAIAPRPAPEAAADRMA